MYEFDRVYGEDYEILEPVIQAQWDGIDATAVEEDLGVALTIFKRVASWHTKFIHSLDNNERPITMTDKIKMSTTSSAFL